jgi:hypothetical protein
MYVNVAQCCSVQFTISWGSPTGRENSRERVRPLITATQIVTSRDCLSRSRLTILPSTFISPYKHRMADSSTTASEEAKAGFSARLFECEQALEEQNVYVSLTYDELNAKTSMDRVKSPKAGAVVLFSGTAFHNIHGCSHSLRHTLTDNPAT